MTGIKEERLMKLQGTSSHSQKISYNSCYDECTLPSCLLWHARFWHLNYYNLRLLNKSGVIGLPTIPRKPKQYDDCILGKHNKQSFHDSDSKSHRKFKFIHSDLRSPVPVPFTMVINTWWHLFMTTRKCVGCIYWRTNLKLLKHSKPFMHGLKMIHNIILDLSILIMEDNILRRIWTLSFPAWDQTLNNKAL